MEIIVVTAGVGFYEVDGQMRRVTKQRVLDTGVGVNLVWYGVSRYVRPYDVLCLRSYQRVVVVNIIFWSML